MSRRRDVELDDARFDFWCAGVADGCVMDGDHEGPIHSHHVVTQQELRKVGREDAMWDVRNALGLCELHHTRHHRRFEPVPFSLLPARCIEFAVEVGCGFWLERTYPMEMAA